MKNKTFYILVSILIIIITDILQVFITNSHPILSITRKNNNNIIYYSIGYKFLQCENGNQKAFLWNRIECPKSPNKYQVIIKKTDTCLDHDKFYIYYDETNSIDYFIRCVDTIYLYDTIEEKKYSLIETIEKKILPITEILKLINNEIPIEKSIRTEGFEITPIDNCKININFVYSEGTNQVYSNCINVKFNNKDLQSALNEKELQIAAIYDYIDTTSKYAQAIKTIGPNGQFIFSTELYSIVSCNHNVLIYTNLGLNNPYLLCDNLNSTKVKQ